MKAALVLRARHQQWLRLAVTVNCLFPRLTAQRKDYSDNAGTIWIITAEAFDPATRLVDQALASNPIGVGAVGPDAI